MMTMQTAKRRTVAEFSLIAMCTLVACTCLGDFNNVEVGSPLLEGFSSYASQQSIRVTTLAQTEIRTEADRGCDPQASNPCFEIVRLRAPYMHLETSGELALTFFNDRLYATTFFPRDLDAYVDRLKREMGRAPVNSEPLEISDETLFWIVDSEQEGRFVAWADSRLRDEYALWIRCFETSK